MYEEIEQEEKSKQTNLKKLGVEYPQQNKDILEKSNNTNILKYGVKRPAQNKNIQEKAENTKIIKYNNPFYSNSEKAKQALSILSSEQINTIKEKLKKGGVNDK